MKPDENPAAFQDTQRGDAWRYVLAWAYVCGYTLRTIWRVCFGLLCLLPWVPVLAIIVALALAL